MDNNTFIIGSRYKGSTTTVRVYRDGKRVSTRELDSTKKDEK